MVLPATVLLAVGTPRISHRALPAIPADAQCPAKSFAARQGSSAAVCRATAAAPPPPAPAPEREAAALAPTRQPSGSGIASYPVETDWLAHSIRVTDVPLRRQAALVERLHSMLRASNRWAWQDGVDPLRDQDPGGPEEQAADSGSTNSSPEDLPLRLPLQPPSLLRRVLEEAAPSTRGAGQRSSSHQRHCRGRLLAGAVDPSDIDSRIFRFSKNDLPEVLQVCSEHKLLTAEQETLLGEMVQAARQQLQGDVDHRQLSLLRQPWSRLAPLASSAECLAMAHRFRLTEPSSSSGSSGSCYSSAEPSLFHPSRGREFELVQQRGAAARQLLFSANQRLISLARRKLQAGARLPRSLVQELYIEGRCALWRAAEGYQPGRHSRFSTYAMAAIQNAMIDVLAGQQPVHIPRQRRELALKVRTAASSLGRAKQQEAMTAGLPQLQQDAASQAGQSTTSGLPQAQQSSRAMANAAQQSGQSGDRLSELAAAADLSPRQVAYGLAAGRRQRLVGFGSRVFVDTSSGACGCNTRRQMAPFGDLAEEDETGEEYAASELVQQVLSRLRHDRHRLVLRLRFGFGASGAPPEDAGMHEVDFGTVGRQLGVSRQRAAQIYHDAVRDARATAAAILGRSKCSSS